MRTLALAVFALGLFAGGALAQDQTPADPVLGEGLVEGVASASTLWLRSDTGAVVAFDRATAKRRVIARDGVFGLVRTGGATVVLRRTKGDAARMEVADLATGKALTPAFAGKGAALARAGKDWIVLGVNEVLKSDGGAWRRQAFKPLAKPRFGVAAMAGASDGTVYVGYNMGEWGGGLWRLAPGSDTLALVDGGAGCEDPLSSVCSPVTAVIPDPDRPGCVLAAVGVVHMFMAKGAVMRVCGDKAERVFARDLKDIVKAETADAMPFKGNTLPLYGLIARPGGWTAASKGWIVVSWGGEARVSESPQLKPFAGLMMAEVAGALIAPTSVSWSMSVSGYTPLLIPITD